MVFIGRSRAAEVTETEPEGEILPGQARAWHACAARVD